ncbi:VIT domain-containing protein [Microcoleus sp. FACHB-68]|uniref:VIT domain-containing protein n=1 Tax=Microcoleus sp. FACHB-68 TaxID=2692826 RepID=UPI001689CFC9|nr:VIT domain-containing protein [Microcoleus sp. FACHB-68]MBD1940726.1 after-VIT domain-containing protein [Microcoleus sp. FACHB-68]
MPNTAKDRLGGLYVESPAGEKLVFPLKHTEVLAKIAGNLSRVEVTQSFENPFTDPLEAIYVFPLPDEAAVDDMEIKIGERIIKGSIKKREEAKQIYEQAKRQGRTAGLLEQERDNIFTQSLANIQPGEQIDVTIRYTDSLKFEGGDYEFVFPMVVGPRYIPGTLIDGSGDTDQVPDASRINPPFIPPEMRSRHDIGVTVEIDTGLSISDVRSTSHQLQIEHEGQIVQVKLGGEDTIPNKDLILRYRIAGNKTEATILAQADERGAHYALYFIPALKYKTDEIVAKDVVFLVDTSGSQFGAPIRQCRELMHRFIKGLNPDDTFSIIDFSDTTRQLSANPLPNTPKNRQKAIDYINQLNAQSGTELLNGIKAVMNFPAAPAGRLRSIVLLTDGYIGNDNEILAEVQQNLKPGNRLYSFGVGSSVNRFLLNRIAEIGRGTCQVVRQDESPDEAAEKFFRQINNPVLTNIQINWEGNRQPEIYPSIAPDLFAEQPLVVFGRQENRTARQLHITGMTAGGKRYEKRFSLNFEGAGNPAIAQLWGRQRIKDLMNQMVAGEKKSLVDSVTDMALAYQLLSQYTAFVAVSEEVRVDPEGKRISMQVPVEMAEGVSYETTVGADNANFAENQLLGNAKGLGDGFKTVSRSLKGRSYAQATVPSPQVPQAKANPGSIQGFFNSITEKARGIINQYSTTPEINSHVEIVNVAGLDEAATNTLKEQLKTIKIPAGFSGEIVLEFPVQNGRVGRIILDDQASTLDDASVVDPIKRSLLIWNVPQGVGGVVRITLRINS